MLLLCALIAGGSNAWADYVKVTSAPTDWSGVYLIVYEDGYKAFNGALATLDGVNNTVDVTITDGVISSTPTIDAATFTIEKIGDTDTYSVLSSSGFYIGATNYSNELRQDENTAYPNSISLDGSNNILISVQVTDQAVTLKYNYASNQNRFRYYKKGQQSIALYRKVEAVSVTEAGYATYASNYALDYSNVEGLAAYTASVSGNKVTFAPAGKVPAGAKSGVLIKAAEGTYNVPVIASADDIANDFVRGTGAAVASEAGGKYNYILNKVGGVVGFYAAAGNMVATNRAYLQTKKNEARISLDLDDEGTTAIEAVKTATAENGVFYNLAGQRVAQPTKGLYIVNGKKYIVK